MTPQEGGRVRWTIEADTQPLEDSLTSASRSVESFKKELESTDSSMKNGGIFGEITKQAEGTVSTLKNLGKSLAGTATGTLQAGAAALTTTLVGLTKKGIAATDFLETSRVAMSGLTGSMEEGNKAMSIAANFWANNPFQRIDVTKATQQLVQFGRKTNQLADDLKILGDISLSSGAPIDELARYFGRTAAAGRAMTLDIEMLSDRGIPIYRELAEVLGTTEAGVRDFASKGKIDFETFRTALENAVNPEAMEQYEQTLARQKDRLSGSINTLAGDLAGYKIVNDELVISASGLEKAYTRLLQTLATGLRDKSLREGMEKIGQVIAQLVDKITEKLPEILSVVSKFVNFVGDNSEMLLPILGGALMLFGRLGQQLPVINQLIGGFNKNLGNLTKGLGELASKNPILTIVLGTLAAGFMSAYKNSEEFRNAIKSLFSSLGKIVKAILPAIQKLVEAFVALASSPAVISVVTGIAQALAFVADVISKIPTEILESLIIALIFLATYKHNKILAIAGAITVVVGALSNLWEGVKNTFGGIAQVFSNIINAAYNVVQFIISPFQKLSEFFYNLIKEFFKFGSDIMNGLGKGLSEGAKGVGDIVSTIANGIANAFKTVLGIHSPSKVFTEYGEFIALGLANGIKNGSSAVDKAMDKLASATLQKAQKIVSNKLEFGVLDYNSEYKEWKRIAKLFTEGSSQYESAIEKMEEARKNVNKQIIELQRAYNTELDSTINRLKTMYSMFQQVDVTDTGMDAEQVIKNLDKQVAKMQAYASSQEIISGLNLDEGLVEELKALGVDSANELQAIANMTSDQLSDLNTLWLEKQSIATKEATRQMEGLKDETLKQISDLKDGIDGETVGIQDVGGRLVENIGEGITGALPTLESALADLGKYIAEETGSAGSSVDNLSDTFENLDDTIQKTVDDVKENVEKVKQSIGDAWSKTWPILLGVGGFIVGTKVLPWLSNVGKGLGGLIDRLKGVKNPAKDAGKAIEGVTGTAKGTTKMAESWGSIGKDVVKKLALIAEVAIGIVAIGWALGQAYKSMEGIDWGTMAGYLGLMAIAIGEMGALGWVIGKFAWKEIGKGAIVIAGLAVDIAALGWALGELDKGMQSDFDVMVGKLGAMGLAVLEIGTLGGIIGGLISATGPIGILVAAGGIATLLGIAADISELGKAMGELDRNMTSDFDVMVGKIGAMGAVITEIGVLAAGEGIANFLTLGSIENGIKRIKESGEAVIAIAQSIKDINEVQGLNIDKGQVTEKFNVIKACLEGIQGFTSNGLIGDVINFFTGGNFDINKVRDLANGVRALTEVGKPLAEMPNVTDQDAEKLSPIQTAFDKIKNIQIDGNIGKKAEQARQAANAMGDINRLANELLNLPEVADKSKSIENITNAINSLLGKGIETINVRVNDYKVATVSIVDAIINAFTEREGKMWDAGNAFGAKFEEGLKSKNGDIANAGRNWQSEIWGAIQPKLQDEYYQGQALANEFKNGVASVNMTETGNNAAYGFLNGIKQLYDNAGWSAAYNVGKELANKVLQGIKDKGKEGSPWKTTFQSGVWAAEGLYEGIKSSENLVVNEAKTLASQVVDTLDLGTTTMTPTLSASTNSLPLMSVDENYTTGVGRRNVIIEQTNNNYTDYSIEKVNRDLAWQLSFA